MLRYAKRWAFSGGWLAIALACGSWLAPATRADDAPQGEQLLREQLAAGEFAPAFGLAAQQANPAEREALLGELVAAQGRAGARAAAFATATAFDNDQLRFAALQEARRQPVGGQGGGVQPDFDSLIELLTATVAPTTWSEVGGNGAIKEFRGGVAVDTTGAMSRLKEEDGNRLARLRDSARVASEAGSIERRSTLRKVSLTRLEREVQTRLAAGRPLDDAMQVLAGIERVQYVLVYPETGDIVIAGPAGGWTTDREGRTVSTETGRPVLRLEDLVVLWQHLQRQPSGKFGCSITPTQESLARTQAFVAESAKKPLKAGQRGVWLEQLRGKVGAQDITVDGVDSRTRVARVLVEADYRMKLVGIGLEPGTLNVPSYLSMIVVPPGTQPPPLDVLRWWFTMKYDAIEADKDRQAFALRGEGVQVLCENEMLGKQGERIHTGQAQDWNHQFARNFTKHFAALAAKYPIYAELQNVFDLAMVATLIKHEHLDDRTAWHATCFGRPGEFPISLEAAPKTVQTVINHRVVNQINILAAVSGGVTAYPVEHLEAVLRPDQSRLDYPRQREQPTKVERRQWWWD